jgi:hypothetical protein
MKAPLLAALALAALPAPALAQQARAPAASANDVRINQLIVYGDQRCPQSTDQEIVICYKAPDSPYRIPAPLRDREGPASQSWSNRAMELQYVGRTGTESCSAVGPGGFTGCLTQFINQARAEGRGGPQVNWNALIEQARQERLGRIDADSEAIEREQNPR